MTDNVLTITFLAKDKFSNVADHVSSKLGGMTGAFTRVGAIGAKAIGGVAVGGILALSGAMIKGVKDATAYQTLGLKTAAVIKSTGGVAHVTVPHVQALASSLESMSGVEEELIINSENVLMTFTNVRNSAGKNNDIFDQSTRAILDMSVALGTDMQSATIQVGKALNNPIKGITALQRVGVSFTDAQKKQIEAMVKSGNIMGAQKVILKELQTEFGGAAKAAGSGFAGAMARLKDKVGDTFRDLATKFLPILTTIVNWIADKVVPAIGDFAGKVADAIPKIIAWFGQFTPTIRSVWEWLTQKLFPAVRNVTEVAFGKFQSMLQSVGKAISDHKDAIDALKKFFGFLGDIIIKYVIPALGWLSGFVIDHIGPAVDSILDLIGGIADLAKNLGNSAKGIYDKAKSIVDSIVKGLAENPVAQQIGKVASAITDKFKDAGGWLLGKGKDIIGALTGDKGMGNKDRLKEIGDAADKIKSTIQEKLGNANEWAGKIGQDITKAIADGMDANKAQAETASVGVRVALQGGMASWPPFMGGMAIMGVDAFRKGFVAQRAVIDAVGDMLHKWIVDPLAGLATDMVEYGKAAARGLAAGMQEGLPFLAIANAMWKLTITEPFKLAFNWFIEPGKQAVEGMIFGIRVGYPGLLRLFFTIIKQYALTGFQAVTAMATGIWNALPALDQVIRTMVTKFIINPFRGTWSWLWGAGFNLVVGFVNALTTAYVRVQSFFVGKNGMIPRIISFFAGAPRWLFSAGWNLLAGFWSGGMQVWIKVYTWLASMGGWIKDRFVGSIKWLWNPGWNIIRGLWDGMGNVWNKITAWVSGIGIWIKQHKGPVSVDRLLLVPAGRAIMQGFFDGLQSGGGAAWDFVKRVGGKTKEQVAELYGWVKGLGWNALSGVAGFLKNMINPTGGTSVEIGKKLAAKYGWGSGQEWASLYYLWMGESGWNPLAHNASSGAHGIPQALPASKMAPYGADYWTSAATQIRWGLDYIAGRYGSPAKAYAFWLAQNPHWYDEGGIARGPGFIAKRTIAPERVLSPAQTRWFERAMAQGVRGTSSGRVVVEQHYHFPNYVGDERDLIKVLNNAAKLGKLDPIVRMAQR